MSGYPPESGERDLLSAPAAELLKLRLSGRARRSPDGPVATDRPQRPPLSFAQHRLWFIDQLTPGILAYNIQVSYRLRGDLDAARLERAIGHVLDQHEVLRAHYPTTAGEPYQAHSDQSGFRLPIRAVPPDGDPESAARDLVRASADAVFDLARGPLFRAVLVRLAPQDHVLGIAVHHSVFDRDSLEIWCAEVSSAYAGDSPAPPRRVQYADFAVWQRAALGGAEGARHLSYWREYLAGAPPLLELPADRARPATPTYEAGSIPVEVPAPAAGALRALAAERGVTMFMVGMAAYHAVLSRHTRASEVIVGCPVNGRSRIEWEPLIGFFANSAPIRCATAGHLRFTDLLDQVRHGVLEAYAHRDVPFEHLVGELAPDRDLSRNPIVQVWFDLVSSGGSADADLLRLPGVAVELFDAGSDRTRFDMELHLADSGEGALRGRLLYASSLYEPDTAARFARHFATFMTSVARAPEQRLSEVQIFSAEELRLLLGGGPVVTR